MSGEEVVITEKGIAKNRVSPEDFLRWWLGEGGDVEREEIQEEEKLKSLVTDGGVSK